MLGLGSPVRPSVSLSVTWGEAHCTHLPLFPQDGLRVMAWYFQLPPHPSRLLPVRKERHLGHTEAKAELSGIQTAWGLSLSQHRPPASHTSAETGWNHQAGRARCRRPVGGKCLPPLSVSLSPCFTHSPGPSERIRGRVTPGKGTCHHPFTAQTRLKSTVSRGLLACAVCQVFNTCVLSVRL